MTDILLLLLFIAFLEITLSIMQFRFYYKYGISVFKRSISLPGNLPGTLYETSYAIFGHDNRFTIAVFKNNEIGFRKIIRRRNTFFFRGFISHDDKNKTLKFSITLNWTLLFFGVLAYEMTENEQVNLYYTFIWIVMMVFLIIFDLRNYLGIIKSFQRAASSSSLEKIKIIPASERNIPPEYDENNDDLKESEFVDCTKCNKSYFRVDLPQPYCPECNHPIKGKKI